MGIHGKHTRVLMGGYNVSSALKEASTSNTIDKAEHSGFGDGSKKYLLGQGDGSASFAGSYQGTDAAGTVEAILRAALGNDDGVVTTVGRDRLAIGTPAELLLGKESSYEISGSKDDAVQVSVEMAADGGVDNGVVLHGPAAETVTVTGNGTNVDNGAASSAGLVAHLHVLAISGVGATATVKVQHSTDGTTFTDLVTFSPALLAGGPQAQRLAVSGTVNRYLRAQWTIAGTSPSVSFVVAAARLRG